MSGLWLNVVERFFRDITTERLRRGVFTSVPELIEAIDEYIAHHKHQLQPFTGPQALATSRTKSFASIVRLSSK